jgi:hypothetical protein
LPITIDPEALPKKNLVKHKTLHGPAEDALRHPLLVSKREAAAALGICIRTLDALIGTKQLLVRRIGKRVLVPYSALQSFARHDHASPTIFAEKV